MLLETIKARMFKAMKAGSNVEKEILRVAVGEITTAAGRPGYQGTDEEAQAILRKLVKSNRDSLALVTVPEQRVQLETEISVLESLLPQSLSVDAIVEALSPVVDAIRGAGNDGQATGVAMKHLKAQGANVQGKDVSEAVRRVRSI